MTSALSGSEFVPIAICIKDVLLLSFACDISDAKSYVTSARNYDLAMI